jgi:hypothetical protein
MENLLVLVEAELGISGPEVTLLRDGQRLNMRAATIEAAGLANNDLLFVVRERQAVRVKCSPGGGKASDNRE